jgi:hypothetical protein
MKLRLLKPWADHAAGAAVDVPAAVAEGLIAGGLAEVGPAVAALNTPAEATKEEAEDAAAVDADDLDGTQATAPKAAAADDDLQDVIRAWPRFTESAKANLGTLARSVLRP